MSTTNNKPVYWMGTEPDECDICHRPIKQSFIDGATNSGPWAIMCKRCHTSHGRGRGLGRGQQYNHTEAGWEKQS